MLGYSFPKPHPVGIFRPPPQDLFPPQLRDGNVDDRTVVAHRTYPKLATAEMHDVKVACLLEQLVAAFAKKITDAGLTLLHKLFQLYSIDPAIWRERIFVVRRLFEYLKQENGAVNTVRCRKFLEVRLTAL